MIVAQEEAPNMKRNGLLLTMTFLLLCACHPLTQDSISPTNPTPRPTQIQQTIIQIIEQQEYDTIHWISKEDIQNFISLNPSFIEECYLSYGTDDLKMSDLFIIKPIHGKKKAVIDAYKIHQQYRMNQSLLNQDEANFNKAQNALIYEHDDYLIFLLLNHPLQAQKQLNAVLDLKTTKKCK